MPNPWNNLAKYFKTANASSADNVEIVEPVLIKEIQKIDNVKIIDYGCGSGNFCKRISPIVESILGIDTSTEMIKIAKKYNNGKNIKYINKSIHDVNINNFNVLNAEFLFQFVSDKEIDKLLKLISKSNINTIMMTNDNVDFINKTIKLKKDKFSIKGNQYFINLKDNKIKLFPRTTNLYTKLFKKINFNTKKVYELKFPKQFLKKFPEYKSYPTNTPTYTVIIFKRRK